MPLSNLIIWRHAEAEPAFSGALDADRALTAKGMSDAHHMAKWLKKHLVLKKNLANDTQIHCSPAVRCRQTLDALLAFGDKATFNQVEYTQVLALESHVAEILKRLSASEASTILLVGHQPLLGELAAHFLFGKGAPPLDIKKGAIWWLRHKQETAMAALLASTKSLVKSPQSLGKAKFLGKMEVLTVQHPKFFR